MKNVRLNENIKPGTSEKKDVQGYVYSIQQEVEHYKKEKDILLALSNDITGVREKNDLIKIFSSRLKGFFHFTHLCVFLIEKEQKISFLTDENADPIVNTLLAKQFTFTELGSDVLSEFDGAKSFLLDTLLERPDVPAFVKLNSDYGIRETLVTPLKRKMETLGFIFIYSDRADSFTDSFKSVLHGIAPHLSNAITNIVINEEIAQREEEKSMLLSLSNEIAAVRKREDLSRVVNTTFKKLFSEDNLAIAQVNKDDTYSAFANDFSADLKKDAEYESIIPLMYNISDPVFSSIMKSDDPVILDIDNLVEKAEMPSYISWVKKMGVRYMVGKSLRAGGVDIGAAFLLTRNKVPGEIKVNLMKAVCAQLAVAVSNILANEEIAQIEEEKSMLLSLSSEIAAARKREDLLNTVTGRIKTLFAQEELSIAQINEDNTYSAFVLDHTSSWKGDADYERLAFAKYDTGDALFNIIMKSDDPLVLDIETLVEKPGMPPFVSWWKNVGLRYVLSKSLRAGGKDIGCAFLHTNDKKPGEIEVNLMKAVCAQLAVAVSNILANEQIIKKHEEQTFLLDFSSDIARVRTKPELQAAISKVLDKTMHTKLAMIHIIEEDGFNLSPFMYDNTLFEMVNADLKEFALKGINIESLYTSQVLASKDGLVFNINEEVKSGNAFARLWKTTGLKNIYGLPLRAGSKKLGTIWMLADRLSGEMLRGICAQISIAIANIQANEKLVAYKKQLEGENDYLKEEIKIIYNSTDIIGTGPQMQNVYYLMSLVAETNSTVLLLGETGTGKELIARALHNSSLRKSKLMVKVNCAALPANLIESELFGHEKGSFTGAIERRIGKFELANNSTLFLDEIGEIPLETQSKLLRVLQERELERVGGKTTINVDVRIIAATNRNLENEVKAGRFRADLYYRLNVFPITLPSLRDRPEDIVSLAYFFLERYSRISGKKVTSVSDKCLEELKSYTWPGNIREMEHLIERSILLTKGNVLTDIQLPRGMNQERNDRLMDDGNTLAGIRLLKDNNVFSGLQTEQHLKSLEENEREYILSIVKKCNGKISGEDGAAKILRVPTTTLHSKMKKLGIRKNVN